MMTAANVGARVTGWGFIVFTIGSICWALVGITTGQANLLWTNVFLSLVNAVGIWRWLGRQAKYEDGGAAAARRSAASPQVATLFSTSALIGKLVTDRDGTTIGAVVDAMVRCKGACLAYVVISEGGVGGVGERLHAVDPAELEFGANSVKSKSSLDELAGLPVLQPGRWPAELSTTSAAGQVRSRHRSF